MKLLLTSLLFSMTLCHGSFAHAQTMISPCIGYSTQDQNHLHIVRVDLSCPDLQLVGSDPSVSKQGTSTFAQQYNTTVAINGSFYLPDYTPLGLTISQGKHWPKTKDSRHYVFLACSTDNKCLIEAENKTSAPQAQWNLVISGWQSLNNGRYYCAPSSGKLCHLNATGLHPRTAVGLSDDKRYLYLLVAEGRLNEFRGYSLNQIAQVFSRLGVKQAINLDGGGSSTLYFNNRIKNQLSPQHFYLERPVANHFGVIDNSPKP